MPPVQGRVIARVPALREGGVCGLEVPVDHVVVLAIVGLIHGVSEEA